MYSKTWFTFPLALKLAEITLEDDVTLEGDLQECYQILLAGNVNYRRNKSLDAKISKTYHKGETLWRITEDILIRFHLIPVVQAGNGTTYLTFKKGSAWKKGECHGRVDPR